MTIRSALRDQLGGGGERPENGREVISGKAPEFNPKEFFPSAEKYMEAGKGEFEKMPTGTKLVGELLNTLDLYARVRRPLHRVSEIGTVRSIGERLNDKIGTIKPEEVRAPRDPEVLRAAVRPGEEAPELNVLERFSKALVSSREEALVRQATENLNGYIRSDVIPSYRAKLTAHYEKLVEKRRAAGDPDADITQYLGEMQAKMIQAAKKTTEYIQETYLANRHKESRFTPWAWLPADVKKQWTKVASTSFKFMRRTQYKIMGGITEIAGAPFYTVFDYNESDVSRGRGPGNAFARLMEIVPTDAGQDRIRTEMLRQALSAEANSADGLAIYQAEVQPLFERLTETRKQAEKGNHDAALEAEQIRKQIRGSEIETLRELFPLGAMEADGSTKRELTKLDAKLAVAQTLATMGSGLEKINFLKNTKFGKWVSTDLDNSFTKKRVARFLDGLPVEDPSDAAQIQAKRTELAAEHKEITAYWHKFAVENISPEMVKTYVVGKKVNAQLYRSFMLNTESQGEVISPFDSRFDRHEGFLSSWNSYWQLVAERSREQLEALPKERRLARIQEITADTSTFYEGIRIPMLERSKTKKFVDDVMQKSLALGIVLAALHFVEPGAEKAWETGSKFVHDEIHLMEKTPVGRSARLATERAGGFIQSKSELAAIKSEGDTVGTLREASIVADQAKEKVDQETRWEKAKTLIQVVLLDNEAVAESGLALEMVKTSLAGEPDIEIADIKDPRQKEAADNLKADRLALESYMNGLSLQDYLYFKSKLEAEKASEEQEAARKIAGDPEGFNMKKFAGRMTGYSKVLAVLEGYINPNEQ